MNERTAVAGRTRGAPFIARLTRYADLTEADVFVAESLLARTDDYRRGVDLISEGQTPSEVYIVLSGWVMRYALTQDGKRQITNVALPGDVIGYHAATTGTSGYNAAPLGHATVATVDLGTFTQAMSDTSGLGRAIYWHLASENVHLRNQTLRLGRLSAGQRIAHFICEIWVRLSQLGMIESGVAHFPMTQSELADTLGLSLVHTNRQLQELKRGGLITLQRDRLVVPNVAAIAEIGGFKAPLN